MKSAPTNARRDGLSLAELPRCRPRLLGLHPHRHRGTVAPWHLTPVPTLRYLTLQCPCLLPRKLMDDGGLFWTGRAPSGRVKHRPALPAVHRDCQPQERKKEEGRPGRRLSHHLIQLGIVDCPVRPRISEIPPLAHVTLRQPSSIPASLTSRSGFPRMFYRSTAQTGRRFRDTRTAYLADEPLIRATAPDHSTSPLPHHSHPDRIDPHGDTEQSRPFTMSLSAESR